MSSLSVCAIVRARSHAYAGYHTRTILLPRLWYVGVCFVLLACLLHSAQAAMCFDDASRAHRYLLQQEATQTQQRTQTRININRATEAELVSLQGIGSSKAQAIVLYREMFGDFARVDDLAKVKGIGAKTIEKNRARLQVHE